MRRPPISTLFPYTTLFRSISGAPIVSAHPGQYLVAYISGEGDVAPFVTTGSVPSGAAITQPPTPRLPFSMTVGGAAVTQQFVGIPGWSIGVTQVNFQVPSNLAPGVYPVVFTVGTAASPPLNLTVGSAAANVQFTIPPSTNQAADSGYHYTALLSEIGGVGVNFTKLMVFGTDYTSQIANWFGSARLPEIGRAHV